MGRKIKSLVLYDKKGKKIGVVLKKKEFNDFMESVEDLRDAHLAYQRMSKKTKNIPFEQVKKELLGDDVCE